MHPNLPVRIILLSIGAVAILVGLVFMLFYTPLEGNPPNVYQDTTLTPPSTNYSDDTSSLESELNASGDEINSNNSTDIDLNGIE